METSKLIKNNAQKFIMENLFNETTMYGVSVFRCACSINNKTKLKLAKQSQTKHPMSQALLNGIFF